MEQANRLACVDLDVALAQFDGEGTAVEAFAAARDQLGGDARWTREVGFVEHHHNGHLVLRGTFAGHYVDVEEGDRVSEKGAAEGAVAGGLVGVLLGPPGIAVGLVLGGVVGSQVGDPTETDPEPGALVEQLRSAVSPSSSAIVLIARAQDVDEMLTAIGDRAQSTTRQTLTPDQAAVLEASLSGTPPASPRPE
jgi:uncharacterized membrane protein